MNYTSFIRNEMTMPHFQIEC